MKKEEMVNEIYERMVQDDNTITKNTVRLFLKHFSWTVLDNLREGKKIKILPVGSLSPYHSNARKVHTFNGIKRIPPMVRVRFKLFQSAKKYINADTDMELDFNGNDLLEMFNNNE